MANPNMHIVLKVESMVSITWFKTFILLLITILLQYFLSCSTNG